MDSPLELAKRRNFMSNQRVILADYYGYKAQFYHATFDHLSHSKDDTVEKKPVALLKNIYLVDANDKRKSNIRQDTYIDESGRAIIADHCWVPVNEEWFKLPFELLQGDEIYFLADVDQYPITRSDLIQKRKEIWQQAKQLNNSLYSAWQGSKHNYHGAQYSSMYEQMRAHMQSNNDMARQQTENIPMVDYTLTNLKSIKVAHYKDRKAKRLRYNVNQFLKSGYRYTGFLAGRSFRYIQRNNPSVFN